MGGLGVESKGEICTYLYPNYLQRHLITINFNKRHSILLRSSDCIIFELGTLTYFYLCLKKRFIHIKLRIGYFCLKPEISGFWQTERYIHIFSVNLDFFEFLASFHDTEFILITISLSNRTHQLIHPVRTVL